MQASPSDITTTWLRELSQLEAESRPTHWKGAPSTLVTSCTPHNFALATGEEILSSTLSALELADQEILFVTCFWARSPSLTSLSQTLRRLSIKSLARQDGTRIRVRICLSSVSLLQKLVHTSSLSGYIYPPSTWVSRLGLPAPDDLQGLDLQIKSIFIRPMSVMHPKFIIVDRRTAFLLSCNVSWEKWFEGCIELEGQFVGKLVEFWRLFWGRNDLPALPFHRNGSLPQPSLGHGGSSTNGNTDITTTRNTLPHSTRLAASQTPTILLPSSHHQNPHFHPFPFQTPPSSPPTPLNTFLLHAFATARRTIYIQTPNLTSPPVLTALLAALTRGVEVHILTNRRMMVLEQLLTAGTITEFCVWQLLRRYRRLLQSSRRADEERGVNVGKLRIGYYRSSGAGQGMENEPAKSHLKLTVVDEEIVVLGSGNMDRASWYTSQELGVAFLSRELAGLVLGTVKECLMGRVEEYYP
ncbi:MAG: hypothetical protein M1830_000116 [Pleopsidium flavum]|nr:MAG: hypothetical protein M1830_000116 [Pleopsidium flavum]